MSDNADACTCPDPYCPQHATYGVCGGKVIITPDDPAFCPDCGMDVMPARACHRVPATGFNDVADGVSEAEHLERVERQRAEALATIERVRVVHGFHDTGRGTQWCNACQLSWPCPTIIAIAFKP